MSTTEPLQKTEAPDLKVMKKVISAAAVGNFIEWYDFAVYGYLATMLAANFFPGGNPTTALLETFAVFAVAFALRPIGGVFFGRLGDRSRRWYNRGGAVCEVHRVESPDQGECNQRDSCRTSQHGLLADDFGSRHVSVCKVVNGE